MFHSRFWKRGCRCLPQRRRRRTPALSGCGRRRAEGAAGGEQIALKRGRLIVPERGQLRVGNDTDPQPTRDNDLFYVRDDLHILGAPYSASFSAPSGDAPSAVTASAAGSSAAPSYFAPPAYAVSVSHANTLSVSAGSASSSVTSVTALAAAAAAFAARRSASSSRMRSLRLPV